jgi:DNA segregation ATPase FtsK/SpoIIIE, S-DNA-T family
MSPVRQAASQGPRLALLISSATTLLYVSAALVSDRVRSVVPGNAVEGSAADNIAGTVGAWISWSIHAFWGSLYLFVPFVLAYITLRLVRPLPLRTVAARVTAQTLAALLFTGTLAALRPAGAGLPGAGGWAGDTIHALLVRPFGVFGAALLPTALGLLVVASQIDRARGDAAIAAIARFLVALLRRGASLALRTFALLAIAARGVLAVPARLAASIRRRRAAIAPEPDTLVPTRIAETRPQPAVPVEPKTPLQSVADTQQAVEPPIVPGTRPSWLTPQEDDAPACVSNLPAPQSPAWQATLPARTAAVPSTAEAATWAVPMKLFDPPEAAREAASEASLLDDLGQKLLVALDTFGIRGEMVGRSIGARIVSYLVSPPSGTRVNRLESLDREVAIALRQPSVRIGPAPLDGAIGIEVPHPEPRMVRVRELFESPEFSRSELELPIALGLDLQGRPIVEDLATMPHLLVAGATGTGKSVGINAILASLCVRHAPESLRLILVDPKRVELDPYRILPHLRHPVICEASDVAAALRWAVLEMERRYELLRLAEVRNLKEYAKFRDGWQPETEDDETPEALPYVVIVVDEFADLMMTEHRLPIQTALIQIAQKARAVGIHLILATQRPDKNVVDGLLKANFPARVAFRVSQALNSQIILDEKGAESLLGNGDMLLKVGSKPTMDRIQGAFIGTREVKALAGWCHAARPDAALAEEEDILAAVKDDADVDVFGNPNDRDDLFGKAARLCVDHDQASTSLLQRKMGIGYGRAARIIDQLEEAGFVGPGRGSKPRQVLVSGEDVEAMGL